MGLFNFGKKKDEVKAPTCACNAPVEKTTEEINGQGTKSSRCRKITS